MAESDVHEKRRQTTPPFVGVRKYKIFKDIVASCGSLHVILKEGTQIEVQNPATIGENYIIINESLLIRMTDLDGKPLLWKTNKKLLDEQRLHVRGKYGMIVISQDPR